jgi:hypothetical protein
MVSVRCGVSQVWRHQVVGLVPQLGPGGQMPVAPVRALEELLVV